MERRKKAVDVAEAESEEVGPLHPGTGSLEGREEDIVRDARDSLGRPPQDPTGSDVRGLCE